MPGEMGKRMGRSLGGNFGNSYRFECNNPKNEISQKNGPENEDNYKIFQVY